MKNICMAIRKLKDKFYKKESFGLMPLSTLLHSYCRLTMCLCKHLYLLHFSLDFQNKYIYRLLKPWCIPKNWYSTNMMINNNRMNEKFHCYCILSVRPFVCPCVCANIYIFTIFQPISTNIIYNDFPWCK